jgi:hypothetical protein
MSLLINVDYYGPEGEIIAKSVYGCNVTTYDDFNNLNKIHQNFFENYDHPMTLHNEKTRYVSPTHLRDYMFDLKTRELLANRFTK